MSNMRMFGSACSTNRVHVQRDFLKDFLASHSQTLIAFHVDLVSQVYKLNPSQVYYTGTTDELDFAICGVGTEEQRGTLGASLSQWGYLRMDKQLGKVGPHSFKG